MKNIKHLIVIVFLFVLALTGCTQDVQPEVPVINFEDYAYSVTFVTDDNIKIYVYDGQDYTQTPNETKLAYSKTSAGELTKEDGQINFKIVVEDGFEIASINITDGYKNLKNPSDTGNENTYRITKITNDIIVTINSQSKTVGDGYKISFVENENLKIFVFNGQNYTADSIETFTAYSYNVNTESYDKSGEGQVNFKVVLGDGYLINKISIDGGYKNLKDIGDGIYRITKITSDLTVDVKIYDEHEVHEYNIMDTDDIYLASEANCFSPAKYYYSCRCGKKGTEIFDYGSTKHNLEVCSFIVDGHEEIHNCVDFVCTNCLEHFFSEASYENTGMCIMELNGALDDITKENKKEISLTFDSLEIDLDCDATIKAQGATSSTYPKKNFSIQLFKKGTNYKTKEKVEFFEGCGKQSKYCLKADYVDTSHTRNLIGANLAREVVKSRGNIDELYNLTNAGLTDGFPILIYNNNSFYGLYTLVIPKDKWMYDMDDSKEQKMAIFNTTNKGCSDFSSLSNYEFTNGFDLEFCSTEDTSGTDWVADSINDLITFIINNDGQDFKNGIEEFMLVERIIDVILCVDVFNGWDNIKNNLIMVTYDGKKWIPSMYDMDTSFGFSSTYDRDLELDKNLLFKRIIDNYSDELIERYLELRETIFTKENFEEYVNFLCENTLDCARIADKQVWNRGMEKVIIKNYANYFKNRLEYLDSKYCKD